ncbi:MAG: nitrogen system component [Chthoniobacter sp.]|jgi:mannitol/fructose-specific phosphotransferase system IIA component (Ntr-type)|nr:nitrogen system component [Chthoniobacter sp.]
MTNALPEILHPRFVKLDLATEEKAEAIGEVAALLAKSGSISDPGRFLRELLARDELSSTVVGHGIAFPHARTDCVSELLIGAGRSESGVRFGDERVHLVFVIGTPPSKIKEYLVAVGALARLVKNEATREQLLHAETAEDFTRCLCGTK